MVPTCGQEMTAMVRKIAQQQKGLEKDPLDLRCEMRGSDIRNSRPEILK
jgi:hypothetical protein